jgi:hypothetical protein
LRKQGIEPGPLFKQVLDALRAGWLDGTVKSVEEEQELLKSLLLT